MVVACSSGRWVVVRIICKCFEEHLHFLCTTKANLPGLSKASLGKCLHNAEALLAL